MVQHTGHLSITSNAFQSSPPNQPIWWCGKQKTTVWLSWLRRSLVTDWYKNRWI